MRRIRFALIVSHDIAESTWDKEFQSQETFFKASAPQLQPLEENQTGQARQQPPYDADDLARTAGLLVNSVKNEQNPKFRKSEFLGLMEQLRDRTVIVEGNHIIHADTGMSSATEWSNGLQGDIKGKGRAVGRPPAPVGQVNATGMPAGLTRQGVSDPSSSTGESVAQEDLNDAYFRQENEEYAQYWNEYSTQTVSQTQTASPESAAWDHLQRDWDQFEATSSGIKPVSNYQFQTNNPYLLHDSSRTRHHTVHLDELQTSHEVCPILYFIMICAIS